MKTILKILLPVLLLSSFALAQYRPPAPAGTGSGDVTTSQLGDSTAVLRTLVGTKLAASDTGSLSDRINLKLAATDTGSLSNRINLKLAATDTGSLSNRINLKLAAADTASLSNRINALKDTVSKGGNFQAISAADSLCLYVVDQWGLTAIYVKTKLSDTSHVVFNVWRDRGGVRVKLFSSNQTVTQGVTTSIPNQNTDVLYDDYYVIEIVSLTGVQADMLVQLSFNKQQR